LFTTPISIPQYNYRLGYFFNRKKGLAFEINFDHTKHIIQDGQQVKLSGTLNGKQTDSTINFSEGNGFYYYLNNGANFLLFNIVKRWNWQESKTGNFKLDALGKAGIGPVIPHVQNSFFGKANDPGFQLGGWNMGVEAGARATFYKRVYLEFTNKIDYASYSNLKVYQGTARQAFGTYELILSLGFTIPAGRISKRLNRNSSLLLLINLQMCAYGNPVPPVHCNSGHDDVTNGFSIKKHFRLLICFIRNTMLMYQCNFFR
jgi:hypothetical protein